MRVTGIGTFGDVDSIGTATFALFDLHAAQQLFHKSGSYDRDPRRRRRTRSASSSRRRCGDSLQVQTAAANDRFTLDGLKMFVKFMKILLLVFGGIAIFVGAFTIYNTLSITVAQRSRELALLRALGATRRQVLRSVVVEALVDRDDRLASIGVAAGIGLAKLISGVFALRRHRPAVHEHGVQHADAHRRRSRSGIVVTVVAGLGPALRATRVSPVSAMREGAEIPPGRIGAPRSAVRRDHRRLALAVLGLGLFGPGIDVNARLALLAPGALLLFIAVALISPRLVPRLAGGARPPGARIAGSAGMLARRNAMRNPGRTAATAAALMIGIALVAFSAVLGAGMRESMKGALADQVRADYVLVGQDGWSPIDPDAAKTVANVPGVQVSTGLVQDRARAFGDKIAVDGVDEKRIASVFGFDWKAGSDSSYAKLASGGAIVTRRVRQGSPPVGGRPLPGHRDQGRQAGAERGRHLEAGQVQPARHRRGHDRPVGVSPGRSRPSASATRSWRPTAPRRPALEKALAPFADVKLQSKSEFETDQSAWVDQILGIFYVLLGLAVIVSLFGIVNTLALSVLERTRELGMLRAIGMSRRQVRRMIRHESVVTALIGAVLGIAVGLFLAGLATAALSGEGLRFALPVGSLIAFTVVAGVAGVLAAMGPARRASRLDVLHALQYE